MEQPDLTMFLTQQLPKTLRRFPRTLTFLLGLILSSSAVVLSETIEPVAAPEFTLPIIANGSGQLNLADLRGNVVYLDFWASWCGPCRLSLPALDGIYQTLKADGLVVAAVSVDVVEEDSLDFLERYQVSYPVAIDTEGEVPRAFSVNGMPSGYLIDREGRVRAVHVGFKRGDELALADEIRALLAE